MTSKTKWNLDQLKSQLSQCQDIKGWVITQEHVHRRERYFMTDGKAFITDQDRNVHSQNLQLKIFVHVDKPGRQGEISKKLFTSMPLTEQIESAVFAAKQSNHQAWELPSQIPPQSGQLLTTDPRMAEDLNGVMEQVTDQIRTSVEKKRDTVFNSSELFLSVHDREIHLSNGLIQRSSQSRVYAEAAFSYASKGSDGKPVSDEFLSSMWTVHLDHLPIEQLFDETSDRARHSLEVHKPKTGLYSVMVDAEVLATLFNGHLVQLSAGNSYNGLPFVKPGDELIPQASGDLLSITLDPSLDFGADTTVISEQGLMQSPLKLVERNKVISTLTDKQYADYMRLPATTSRGNVVVDPGKLSHTELTQQAPQVLEILQFSGLFADPNTGTFSSEIRLAKLYDNKTREVTYIKGGSLSGSISENFKNARFSKECVKRAHFSANSMQGQGYFGPEYILLSDVSVTG